MNEEKVAINSAREGLAQERGEGIHDWSLSGPVREKVRRVI